MEWQPIESAPRDGTVVLVNDTNPDCAPWVASAYYDGEDWSDWIYDDQLMSDHNPLGPRPTHWLPIPPPPKEQP